jgi:hypothetical protein
MQVYPFLAFISRKRGWKIREGTQRGFREDVEASGACEILKTKTQGAPTGAPWIQNFRTDLIFYPQARGL